MDNINPHLDPSYLKQLKNAGLEDEERLLTQFQEIVFPMAMWLFDPNRNRGMGRTYLMAIVCIELAMRGHKVYLNDYTIWPTMGERLNTKRNFIELVMNLIHTKFKGQLFEYCQSDSSLIYTGRKPR